MKIEWKNVLEIVIGVFLGYMLAELMGIAISKITDMVGNDDEFDSEFMETA